MSERFTETALKFLQKIIQDEESLMPNPSDWILREANKHQVLLNYATFQASLISCIEEKIAQCWVKFLELIDQNDNLLLLKNQEELWINLLHIVMKNSPNYNKDDKEAEIQGFELRSTFPFSSYIVKDITEKINAEIEAKGFLFIFIFLIFLSLHYHFIIICEILDEVLKDSKSNLCNFFFF